MTASWSTSSSSQRATGCRPRARVTVEMMSRFPSAPLRGQLFSEVLTTTESSRRRGKALHRRGVRNTAREQAGQLKFEEARLRESASASFGTDAQMQWMYDTCVTQGDEAFEYSDAHLASYHHEADCQAILCTLPARDSVRSRGEAISTLRFV